MLKKDEAAPHREESGMAPKPLAIVKTAALAGFQGQAPNLRSCQTLTVPQASAVSSSQSVLVTRAAESVINVNCLRVSAISHVFVCLARATAIAVPASSKSGLGHT